MTLTGVGGAGKTRLAAEVAGEVDPEVCWCELAALRTNESVAPPWRRSWGATTPRSLPRRSPRPLEDAGVLLVLDSCEHVLEGAAELVDQVIHALPGARVLATSREPLGVEGEQVVALGPLGPEAVELFADRARLAVWDFELSDATAADVARICERLDGLPLAIELAAARIRSLSPAEIVEHLDHRFELLARPRARGEERHRRCGPRSTGRTACSTSRSGSSSSGCRSSRRAATPTRRERSAAGRASSPTRCWTCWTGWSSARS